jgi:predicted nucleotidyltransferase
MTYHTIPAMPQKITAAISLLCEKLGRNTEIYLFGSRASGNAQSGSDWDIAIDAKQPVFWTKFANARLDAQDKAWPYKLDIIDLNRASGSILQSIKTNMIKLCV